MKLENLHLMELKDRTNIAQDVLDKLDKSQEELANELGVDPSTISRHLGKASKGKTSRRNPNFKTMSAYAKSIGPASAAKLFIDPGGEKPKKKAKEKKSKKDKDKSED